jgi:hypothetical protein
MKRTFYVKALWDDEAEVWYSETDTEGLFIEAVTLGEFEDIMPELARDMIFSNHNTGPEFAEPKPQDRFAAATRIPHSKIPTAA